MYQSAVTNYYQKYQENCTYKTPI